MKTGEVALSLKNCSEKPCCDLPADGTDDVARIGEGRTESSNKKRENDSQVSRLKKLDHDAPP
jgi:hypothetical protein